MEQTISTSIPLSNFAHAQLHAAINNSTITRPQQSQPSPNTNDHQSISVELKVNENSNEPQQEPTVNETNVDNNINEGALNMSVEIENDQQTPSTTDHEVLTRNISIEDIKRQKSNVDDESDDESEHENTSPNNLQQETTVNETNVDNNINGEIINVSFDLDNDQQTPSTTNDGAITRNISTEGIKGQKSNVDDEGKQENASPAKTKMKWTRKLFIILTVCNLILVTIIIIVLVVLKKTNIEEISHQTTDIPTANPTIEPTLSPFFDSWFDAGLEDLPKPGVPFEYLYQNQTQNLTLNVNVTYFKPDTTLTCIIEFDEHGKLDANVSYIQILDDFSDAVHINSILLAGAPQLANIDVNCSLAPAVKVTNIMNDTVNGILTLKIREVEMFDYIDEVDVNITNGTLIDTGIDIGEIQRIKNLANYFSNDTKTVINENGTATNISFTNITYTEMVTICYNVSEDGTIFNNITMINGICDDLNAVDYFGQQYGIDSIQFGDIILNGSNTSLYGVNDGENRRRLIFGFVRKIVKKVKKVVKKVVNFVKDIIDILRGDINKRVFELSLSIDASKTYSVSGIEDTAIVRSSGKASAAVSGSFNVESGVDFYGSIYCDFVAKYKIFSLKPSFDLFRLTIGGETRFKAYVDITIDGKVNLKFEIARVERRKIFMLGPIPIVIRPYAAISFGIEAEKHLDFAFEFGYHPTTFSYGIEWSKQGGGWRSIQNPLLFEPFKNFGSEIADDECLKFGISPFIEVRIGVIFYEIVDVAIVPTIKLITQFQYPATCDSTDRCSHSPFQAKFRIDFEFAISIGLKVDLSAINLPVISKSFPLPFNIPPVKLFDNCFETKSNLLSLIGGSCCAADATTTTTLSPQWYRPYSVGPDPLNYAAGKQYCESMGTTLAGMHNEEDFEALRTLCQSVSTSSIGCFIGLVRDSSSNSWSYNDGSSVDYGFYSPWSATTGTRPWGAGEPNNSPYVRAKHGDENCAEFKADGGTPLFYLNDIPCSFPRFPLCNAMP